MKATMVTLTIVWGKKPKQTTKLNEMCTSKCVYQKIIEAKSLESPRLNKLCLVFTLSIKTWQILRSNWETRTVYGKPHEMLTIFCVQCNSFTGWSMWTYKYLLVCECECVCFQVYDSSNEWPKTQHIQIEDHMNVQSLNKLWATVDRVEWNRTWS